MIVVVNNDTVGSTFAHIIADEIVKSFNSWGVKDFQKIKDSISYEKFYSFLSFQIYEDSIALTTSATMVAMNVAHILAKELQLKIP